MTKSQIEALREAASEELVAELLHDLLDLTTDLGGIITIGLLIPFLKGDGLDKALFLMEKLDRPHLGDHYQEVQDKLLLTIKALTGGKNGKRKRNIRNPRRKGVRARRGGS